MQNPLLTKLMWLSEQDAITGHTLVESILVIGAPGSGKTSSLNQLMLAIMREGWPMIFQTVKPDDADRIMANAHKAGRKVRVIGDGGSETFDPAFWEYFSTGKSVDSCIDLSNALMNVNKPSSGSSGEARFFDLAGEGVVRAIFTLHDAAGDNPSFSGACELVRSVAVTPQQMETETWLRGPLAQLIKKIEPLFPSLTTNQKDNVNIASQHLIDELPRMGEKTAGSIIMTVLGPLSRFEYQPLRSMLSSGECSVSPHSLIKNNEILMVNFPLTKHGIDTAKLCHIAIKIPFVRGILSRKVSHDTLPIIAWTDEFVTLFSPPSGGTSREVETLATGRSARFGQVSIGQGAMGISSALGEATFGSQSKALCSMYGTKIAFRNSCPDSNLYMANLCGKSWKSIRNTSMSSRDMSVGGAMQYIHRVPPETFAELRAPDSENRTAECIVHMAGKTFEATRTPENPDGDAFIHTMFERGD